MLDFAIMATTEYIDHMPKSQRKKYGQFFTSKETAIFMAGLFEIPNGCETLSILDPGAGSGILSIALLERLQSFSAIKEIRLVCYENDPNIMELLRTNLETACSYSQQEISYEIVSDNYILSQILIDFFNRFTFQQKSYQVIFGINAETAQILKYIKDITVKTPSIDLKKQLELKHRGDRIVEVLVEDVDKHEAANSAYRYINTIIGLHRISQHHKPVYIKPLAQVNEINDELTVISTKVVRIGKNILLRANNENQIQSYFFDRQLLNSVNPPETFFRAVSLHNNALDSKEPTNQLLDLWTAVETLIGFRSGDEDKINVVCDTLTSILNRAYLYSQIAQLHKDIAAVSEESCKNILTNVSGEESIVWKLAKILSVKTYQTEYNKLYEALDEYPLLQYRMELFSKKIFVNSETVYKELVRHRLKLRWQIMRIYRNRNMIVHSGEHMPYLNVILGNLHYYVDAMFDILIEYYHLGFEDNHNVFYHIQKEEMKHWDLLGLDEKGRKIKAQEITDTNYSAIIFNDYKGNAIKNIINQAIADMARKNDVYTSEEIS